MVAETASKPPYYLLDTNILVASIRAGKLGTHVENTFHLKDSGYKPLISEVRLGREEIGLVGQTSERNRLGGHKYNRDS